MVRFLFPSDWTLAARDGAYMKLHVNITANRRILHTPASFLSSDSLIEKTGKISTEKVQAVFES